MHVAITGASSGIGEALAREYARAGAAVTLVARRRELLDGIAASIGGHTFTFAADLTNPERACDFVGPAEEALGPIDVLINNAGVQIVLPIEHTGLDEGEALVRLNLLTPLRLIHRLLPSMLARGSGTIVNIASAASWSTLPGMTHYNVSKAGLAAASETIRGELRGRGVHVLTVYPGPVHTAMGHHGFASYPNAWTVRAQPTGTTEVLARRVRRAVEKKRERIVYPRIYWFSRLFPGLSRFITDRFAPHPHPPDSASRKAS